MLKKNKQSIKTVDTSSKAILLQLPKNTITGTCEDFQKRYFNKTESGGALTPGGKTENSGGITEWEIKIEPAKGQKITFPAIVKGNKVTPVAKLTFEPIINLLYIKSYSLFWDNPDPSCKQMYESFLDEVAIHEGRHVKDITQIIQDYIKKYNQKTLTFSGYGDNIEKRKNDANSKGDNWISNLHKEISKKVEDKNKIYHGTMEGSKIFDWTCPCSKVQTTVPVTDEEK